MVAINSSLLTVTLYSSVVTTLVYNDTKNSAPFMTLQTNSTVVETIFLYQIFCFILGVEHDLYVYFISSKITRHTHSRAHVHMHADRYRCACVRSLKIISAWTYANSTSCSLVSEYRRFERTFCLHLPAHLMMQAAVIHAQEHTMTQSDFFHPFFLFCCLLASSFRPCSIQFLLCFAFPHSLSSG
jgi:hypothetical protein